MAFIQCNVKSEVLGSPTGVNLILPERFPSDPPNDSGLPCLLLLHGLSDDYSTWLRRTSIERYAEPYGLAVVMPDVQRSFYTDMASGRRFWTYVSEELPAILHRLFPLSVERSRNYVAGLSMGGYGAFKLALRHPDRFCAAASLSGCLDLASRSGLPPDDPLRHDFDLIFGSTTDIAGSDNDLFELAREVASTGSPRPTLFQCCGTDDFLYGDNLRFRDHARDLGLEVTYEEGPGNHEWGYWDQHIQRVLEWLPLEALKGDE